MIRLLRIALAIGSVAAIRPSVAQTPPPPAAPPASATGRPPAATVRTHPRAEGPRLRHRQGSSRRRQCPR